MHEFVQIVMADETLAYQLDAGSSDEVKLWLGNLHEALEKQPARELFDKFSRDTTVKSTYLSICSSLRTRASHPIVSSQIFEHIM